MPYFHVVFTVPAPAAEIAFQNKQTVYAILFRTAAETLRQIAADPKHLGAEIGLVAVLHTWGQRCRNWRPSCWRRRGCRRMASLSRLLAEAGFSFKKNADGHGVRTR